MAKQHSNIKTAARKEDLRPVEVYFNRLNASHQNPTNRLLHFICIPLMLFGILGIAWAIPFPYIKFIGSYNGFFNWASFLIAFSVYYTLKLSPNLSYTMLLVLFVIKLWGIKTGRMAISGRLATDMGWYYTFRNSMAGPVHRRTNRRQKRNHLQMISNLYSLLPYGCFTKRLG
jgi:hypothetical protein